MDLKVILVEECLRDGYRRHPRSRLGASLVAVVRPSPQGVEPGALRYRTLLQALQGLGVPDPFGTPRLPQQPNPGNFHSMRPVSIDLRVSRRGRNSPISGRDNILHTQRLLLNSQRHFIFIIRL